MSEPTALTATATGTGPLQPRRRATLSVPTRLQSMPELRRRRAFMIIANLATYAALLAAAAYVMNAGGWTAVDVVMFACFAIGTPWAVLGFWNAVVGLFLLHAHTSPMSAVAPFARARDNPAPLFVRTAVLMTLRNEDPDRAISRLRAVKTSIDATGQGNAFSFYVLSDTNDPATALVEEKLIAEWRAATDAPDRITYRRRPDNAGYKAGNVRDFLERWGADHDLMLPLDADSLMSGDAVVRLARIMQSHPRIGILQSLVVGMPSASPFARTFQFGMRHGMRAYTMGQAWWSADCGPFWGHNAMVRARAFERHCKLPILAGTSPLSGHIMSHDQVEATLMRRAGYEVRVMPMEDGSWEDNPPTILDFAKRDTRWCQGNLQYVKLLGTPGLLGMSRFQLAWAVLMFLGLPAWTLIIALLPAAAWQAQGVADYPVTVAITVYAAFLLMYLSPKIAGFIDAALTPGEMSRFGGSVRFAASAVFELVFSFLQGAVSTLRTSIFMAGLAFGRTVSWGGQSRDAHVMSWAAAVANFWPHTVFGLVVSTSLAVIAPSVLVWSLPLTAGYLLAVPFAVVTSSPALGALMQRARLCAIPEEVDVPREIAAVATDRVVLPTPAIAMPAVAYANEDR